MRLVIMALAANFVIVPVVAFALSRIIPLEQSVQIGLLLLGTAAGAPFLPKLAQIAKARNRSILSSSVTSSPLGSSKGQTSLVPTPGNVLGQSLSARAHTMIE
jgi:predicted Na+-dependent transporter